MKEKTLVLLRHGESVWNRENLFTGWTDVALSDRGRGEAREVGRLLREEAFDICFTSRLKRAIHTLDIALDAMDGVWLPVVKDWRLNERHYGALQGLNKAETAEKYGEAHVKVWRRSFDVRPPALPEGDERGPDLQRAYADIPREKLPRAESLKDTIARVVPCFEERIRPQLEAGKRVLIAAHGNSLRALVMYLEKLSEGEIVELNLPTGVPLVYRLRADFSVAEKKFLGDPAKIAARAAEVAAQGKARG